MFGFRLLAPNSSEHIICIGVADVTGAPHTVPVATAWYNFIINFIIF
jgi:hypothetical protein